MSRLAKLYASLPLHLPASDQPSAGHLQVGTPDRHPASRPAARRVQHPVVGSPTRGKRSIVAIAVVASPTDVALRPRPGKPCHAAACHPSVQVTLLEMDPTIAAGEASLVSGLAEGCPAKRHVGGGDGAGLELRASSWKRDGCAKRIASREAIQDLTSSHPEGAVTRAVLWERRRRERWGLIRQPLGSVHRYGAAIGPTPGTDLTPSEEVADGSDRPDRVEESLVVPAADARVEDGVRKGEEELDVGLDPVSVRSMMVAA